MSLCRLSGASLRAGPPRAQCPLCRGTVMKPWPNPAIMAGSPGCQGTALSPMRRTLRQFWRAYHARRGSPAASCAWHGFCIPTAWDATPAVPPSWATAGHHGRPAWRLLPLPRANGGTGHKATVWNRMTVSTMKHCDFQCHLHRVRSGHAAVLARAFDAPAHTAARVAQFQAPRLMCGAGVCTHPASRGASFRHAPWGACGRRSKTLFRKPRNAGARNMRVMRMWVISLACQGPNSAGHNRPNLQANTPEAI